MWFFFINNTNNLYVFQTVNKIIKLIHSSDQEWWYHTFSNANLCHWSKILKFFSPVHFFSFYDNKKKWRNSSIFLFLSIVNIFSFVPNFAEFFDSFTSDLKQSYWTSQKILHCSKELLLIFFCLGKMSVNAANSSFFILNQYINK